MARREVTGRKPGITADLIERGSGPPKPDDDEADGDEPDGDEPDDEPSQHDEPAAQAVEPLPPIRGPPSRAPKKAAKKARRKPATPVGDGDAYGIDEFCRRHRISVQLFYKFEDDMPDTFSIGKRRLISREAAARWRAEREAAAKTKTATEDA